MPPTKDQVLERLRGIKGPDLQGNIVDLGLVSEVVLKDGRVSFSITVPAQRAARHRPVDRPRTGKACQLRTYMFAASW